MHAPLRAPCTTVEPSMPNLSTPAAPSPADKGKRDLVTHRKYATAHPLRRAVPVAKPEQLGRQRAGRAQHCPAAMHQLRLLEALQVARHLAQAEGVETVRSARLKGVRLTGRAGA